MSAMTVYIHMGVNDAAAYRALSEKMIAFVRDNEPGTTTYEWHLSEDGTEALNIDGFDSTGSFLAHIGNAQEQGFLDQFMTVGDIQRVVVTGAPTADAGPVLEQLGAVGLREIGSI